MIKTTMLLKNMSDQPVYEPWLARFVEPGEKVAIQSNGPVPIQHPDLDDVTNMTAEEEEALTQKRRAEIQTRDIGVNDGNGPIDQPTKTLDLQSEVQPTGHIETTVNPPQEPKQ